MELVDRAQLQELGDLAGKAGREDRFTERYAEVLAELTQALRLMKGVAQMQGGWLQAQAGAAARMN